MKEFLKSFPTATKSNVNAEKSITYGRTPKGYMKFMSCTLLLSAFLLSTSISFAQTNVPGTASISTAIAEPTVSQWKSTSEYSAVITSMKANTVKILENPNLQPSERALYTGFDRMLSYIQVDLEGPADLTKIAEKDYNRVIQEAPSDPILINMQMDEFASLYEALVNKLHQ